MDGIVHILGKDGIDLTLTLDPALAQEARSRDLDPKMRLTTFAPTGVAMMLISLVDDTQNIRLESLTQLAFKPISNLAHASSNNTQSDKKG
jgi:hypothetical protein